MMVPDLRTGSRFLVLLLLLALIPATQSTAAMIRLDWSPSSAKDLDGYWISYGTNGHNFDDHVDVEDAGAVSHTISGLDVGATYYFRIQSYDLSGQFSTPSPVASCEALPWAAEADTPQTPAIISLDQPQFQLRWDVSGFGCAVRTGLEVSHVNQSFANPNGGIWDGESRCYASILSSPSGSALCDARHYEGPGIYEIRVVALDRNDTIICRWSDSAVVEVIADAPQLPDLIVAGPGPGPDNVPRVRVFDPLDQSFKPLLDFLAYGVDGYGVNVSAGDVTGDGRLNIVTGMGPCKDYGPLVRIFDHTGSSTDAGFLAYGTMAWGVKCVTGDVDGDGIDEIIASPGPGRTFGPHVRGWKLDNQGYFQPMPTVSFIAYEILEYGANAVCGDIDGDGIDEIITGTGPGPALEPRVRGWNVDDGTATPILGIDFIPYGTKKFGVNVACGDIDGDGYDEIITGPGPGEMFGPHVRGFNYDGYELDSLSGVNFLAGSHLSYGVVVSCGDIDGDGVDEIVTAPGPGEEEPHTSRIIGWNYNWLEEVEEVPGFNFLAFDENYRYGARVGVARGVR